MQDHISEKESKQRVRDAEVMAGILKRKEKKSKLGLKGFTRRSSSGGILGFNNGKGGLNALLGKIAQGSGSGSKSTNNLLQLKRRNSDVAPLSSGAKNKWGMIKREVCNTMSWKDLLKKRKEARAARAVKAGELTKIHKQLAMKDWSKDSTFVGVEVPLKTIPKTTLVFDKFSGTANSRTTSGGTANNNRNKSGSGNGNGGKGTGLAWERCNKARHIRTNSFFDNVPEWSVSTFTNMLRARFSVPHISRMMFRRDSTWSPRSTGCTFVRAFVDFSPFCSF